MADLSQYKRIMIADDDDIYNYITSRMLELKAKCERIDKKMSGFTALKHLERVSGEGNYPDLIILDMDMPIINGLDFLAKYEEDFYESHPKTKIIVVSAMSENKAKSKALEYPFVAGFLPKPLVFEDLTQTLTE